MSADYLGLIPARGGSKGVPRKNIREFAGKPLVGHTIETAQEAERLDRTLVTTDDSEIRETARSHGAEAPFLRPAELATDEAPTEPVIRHALEYLDREEDYSPDAVVLLQPTSPLRDSDDITAAIEQYETSDASSVVAVTEDHSNRWRRTDEGAELINYEPATRRQDKGPELVETGAIYVMDAARFLKTGRIRVGTTRLYVMNEASSVDIDTPFDFWLAEQIMTEWDDGPSGDPDE